MMQQPGTEVPLTFEEARAFLKVSASTLYRYTSTRRIRFYKPTGRTLYFKASDLTAFAFSRRDVGEGEQEQAR